MLGAIIGDIAGSTYEFNNTKRLDFQTFPKGSSFTDDSICTAAIADAAMHGKPYADTLAAWCARYPHPMGGYGASFARWIASPSHTPYYSFGNGSAMRVSAIGWLYQTDRETIDAAIQTAKISHDHPEGIKGAVVVAMSIFLLRHGFKKERIDDYVKRMGYAIPEYKPFSNPFNETCQNAIPVAMSCFIASTDFEDAIRKAIAVGGDSDTIGAIVGSLAEAHYGIPAWMVKKAMKALPKDIKRVVNEFYYTIGKTYMVK